MALYTLYVVSYGINVFSQKTGVLRTGSSELCLFTGRALQLSAKFCDLSVTKACLLASLLSLTKYAFHTYTLCYCFQRHFLLLIMKLKFFEIFGVIYLSLIHILQRNVRLHSSLTKAPDWREYPLYIFYHLDYLRSIVIQYIGKVGSSIKI